MIKGQPRRRSRGGGGKTLLFFQVCDGGPSTTAGRCLSHPALSRIYRTHCHHHNHHHQGWYPLRGTESLFSDLCAHVFIWKLLVSRDALWWTKLPLDLNQLVWPSRVIQPPSSPLTTYLWPQWFPATTTTTTPQTHPRQYKTSGYFWKWPCHYHVNCRASRWKLSSPPHECRVFSLLPGDREHHMVPVGCWYSIMAVLLRFTYQGPNHALRPLVPEPLLFLK